MKRNILQGRLIIDFDVYLPTRGKNLQRDFVWTLKQKQEFIYSVFKTYGVSNSVSAFAKLAIVCHNFGNYDNTQTWQIIDGKQRLSTMLDFLDDKFPFTFEGEDYYYSELNKDMKGCIDRFWFNASFAYWGQDVTDQDKVSWFAMLNFTGTPQDVQHFESIKHPTTK